MVRTFTILSVCFVFSWLAGCRTYYEYDSVVPVTAYSTDYLDDVAFTVPPGGCVLLHERRGNYCYVQYQNSFGWVPFNQLAFRNRCTARSYAAHYSTVRVSGRVGPRYSSHVQSRTFARPPAASGRRFGSTPSPSSRTQSPRSGGSSHGGRGHGGGHHGH
jgi:hypothetical protein